MPKNLSDNAKQFLAQNPTRIGSVQGYDFYEHPTMGDESPLIMITPEGKKKRSDFWEMPSFEEIMEAEGKTVIYRKI